MKNTYTYAFIFVILSFPMLAWASDTQDDQVVSKSETHTTEHPPHDHHEPDHAKKLDESTRRRTRDDEED